MSDPRFARLKSDPRFRRVHKKDFKVVVDERFKGVFEGSSSKKDKKGKGRVDKYGRPLSNSQEHDNLRRLYRFEDKEDDGKDGEPSTKSVDYARGEVLLESDEEDNAQALDDDDSDSGGVVTLGGNITKPIHILGDEEPEVDLDEDNFADLDAQAAEYSKVHDSDSEAPEATRTRRLAVVNLDWDHVRATHLYKIFSSLVSPTAPVLPSRSVPSSKVKKTAKGDTSRVVRGKVHSVRVYPSEFGKERLAREEKEGPPKELFSKTEEEDDGDLVLNQTDDGEDYNEEALRKYQLDRLRYYYAVVECDNADTASHLYSELEGTELERSANVFDLSFVPDEMTFDVEFRDEATEDVNGPYKPLDFATDALRHSKVKLTWDDDDPERDHITRRTLSRKEIEENDFKAYLASDTESESEAEGSKSKVDRDKLRSLLLSGGDDTLPEGWGKGFDDHANDVDMEITFTPGLSEHKADGENETTLEKYQRKMKQKKQKRKEEMKQKTEESERRKVAAPKDDFFASDDSDGGDSESEAEGPAPPKGKESKSKARTQRKEESEHERHPATAEELALLAASSTLDGEPKHFDMKAVLKAEKRKGKKGKRKKGKINEEEANELQEDFSIDVKDDRFKAVLEDHTFAIDPSNPHFKKTKSMSALLEERSKRQKVHVDGESTPSVCTTSSDSKANIKSLVESVKRKSAAADAKGIGKRRKL